MRRVRYSVAMSLDGYIAGPTGEFDWIPVDPDIDFAALFKDFDTVLMGRKSYEAARKQGGYGMPGPKAYVFSRTLPVLLGGGLPMLPGAAALSRLKLTSHRVYEKTGTVLLHYDRVIPEPRRT